MTYIVCIPVALLVVSGNLAAGNIRIPEAGGWTPPVDGMTYFDGTPWWLSWDGLYRGTWFNAAEFYGYPTSYYIQESEMWFYHHSSYPWDTSEVWFHVYNGDQMAPVDELDQTQTTAAHCSAVEVVYDPGISCEQNFWVIANTEMSGGGWPSLIGDNTANYWGEDHSFYSEDFIVWEPWVIQGPVSNDYWMATEPEPWNPGFQSATWGAVKTLY